MYMFYEPHIEDIEQLKSGAVYLRKTSGAKDIKSKHREGWSTWKVKIEISNYLAIIKVKFSTPYTIAI